MTATRPPMPDATTHPTDRRRGRDRSKAVTKRLFDIIFSLAVLVLCAPLCLALAIAISRTSPGPIFYIQERVGKNHRRFGCIKFRTMVPNADVLLDEIVSQSADLRQEFTDNFKLKNDPRITKLGKFLRITNLDEFPQFINVLKGDMSVVGPRPLVPEEIERYGGAIDRVLSIRPGITGLWQVSGRNNIPYKRRIQIDLSYVKRQNLWLDIRIICKTILLTLIVKNNGAY